MKNKILWLGLFGSLIILMIYFGFNGCVSNYSEGARIGTITRLSYKGLLFKSWEGEMNCGGLPVVDQKNLTANVWRFSVNDTEVYKFKYAMKSGNVVEVHYQQWGWKPITQDTGYNAVKVNFINNSE